MQVGILDEKGVVTVRHQQTAKLIFSDKLSHLLSPPFYRACVFSTSVIFTIPVFNFNSFITCTSEVLQLEQLSDYQTLILLSSLDPIRQ